MFWATFVSKFVAKKFQKSPNLVTLQRRVSAAAAVAGRCTKTTIFKSAKFSFYSQELSQQKVLKGWAGALGLIL